MFDKFKQLIGKREPAGPVPRDAKTAMEWMAEGRFEARGGSIAAAIECYENAIALDPGMWDALSGLADLYNKQGRLDDALEMFSRAIEAEPALQDAHYQMGHIYLQRKDIARAAEAFERELKVTPKSGRVHNDLAVAYLHLKRYDDAILHCEQAIQLGEYVNEKFLAALAPHRKRR